jgi:SAM-dependent methyltransferase
MPASKLARVFGRQAFGDDPASYHRSRPEYPGWVYDTLRSRCGLGRNTPTFEIGAGTGTATHRLLELGADPLTAIEPDPRLADFLRTNNPDKGLKVLVTAFEEAGLEEEAFDWA